MNSLGRIRQDRFGEIAYGNHVITRYGYDGGGNISRLGTKDRDISPL